MKGFLQEYGLTLTLITLSLVLVPFSGLGPVYLIQELLHRLGRNAILVLALLPMLWAGMGFNFALGAGAMAAQIGMILAVAFDLVGLYGLAFATLAGLPIAVFVGWISGLILNRMKGMEMIFSFLLVPFLFYGFYQLIVLYGMGSIIPVSAADLLLERGYGIRNTVSLDAFRQSLDNLLPVQVGAFTLPAGTYLVIAAIAALMHWSLQTQLGRDILAVGSDPDTAEAAGTTVNGTRMKAVMLSMVIACIGQVVFLQNMGNMGTYIAHDQTSFFAVSALMVGGATWRSYRIRNAFIGVPILHALFVVAPGACQRIFGSGLVGEYFRQFIGWGILAVGIVRYGMAKSREAEAARMEREASR